MYLGSLGSFVEFMRRWRIRRVGSHLFSLLRTELGEKT